MSTGLCTNKSYVRPLHNKSSSCTKSLLPYDYPMPNFKERIGQTICVLLTNETKTLGLTIRGVEDGGLWVESSEMNEALRRATTLDTVGLHP